MQLLHAMSTSAARYYSAIARGHAAPIPFVVAVERLTDRILTANRGECGTCCHPHEDHVQSDGVLGHCTALDTCECDTYQGPEHAQARNAAVLCLRAALDSGVSAESVGTGLAAFLADWPEGGVECR